MGLELPSMTGDCLRVVLRLDVPGRGGGVPPSDAKRVRAGAGECRWLLVTGRLGLEVALGPWLKLRWGESVMLALEPAMGSTGGQCMSVASAGRIWRQ